MGPRAIQDCRHKVVRFSPKQWHGTQEWIGNRITVTSFVSRGVYHLSSEEHKSLKSLGFNSPPKQDPTRPRPSLETNQQSLAAEDESRSQVPPNSQARKEEDKIMKQLHLLHSATGHGSIKTMIETLKRRGVSPKVSGIWKLLKGLSVRHVKNEANLNPETLRP